MSYGHSAHILARLAKIPCTYCGTPVGVEMKGFAQCRLCIRRMIELDGQGLEPEQADRILTIEGQSRRTNA